MVQPTLRKGDVVLFLGGATVHGALPWATTVASRRCAIFTYQSKDVVVPLTTDVVPRAYSTKGKL